MNEPPLRPPGSKVGKFKIEKLIGQGGMADVYLAHEDYLDRQVAVKVLPLKRSADGNFRELMRREAAAGARVRHRNLVEIIDGGVTEQNEVFLVMEYLGSHRTLREIIYAAAGPLDLDKGLRIGIQVADAIAACHALDIWHRDLKPENVVMLDGGLVKVIDFGLARIRSNAIRSTDKSGKKLTTPIYASPEQNWGNKDELTGAVDVWAIGCILFEIHTGKQIWELLIGQFPNAQQATYAMQFNDPPKLAEMRPDLPPSLTALVDRCLTRAPEQRPKVREIARALAAELSALKGKRAPSSVIASGQPTSALPSSDLLGHGQPSSLPVSSDSRFTPPMRPSPLVPASRQPTVEVSPPNATTAPMATPMHGQSPARPQGPMPNAVTMATNPGHMQPPKAAPRTLMAAQGPVFAGAAAPGPAQPSSVEVVEQAPQSLPPSVPGHTDAMPAYEDLARVAHMKSAYQGKLAATGAVDSRPHVSPAPDPKPAAPMPNAPSIDWEGGLAQIPLRRPPVAGTEAMPFQDASRPAPAQPRPVQAQAIPPTVVERVVQGPPPGFSASGFPASGFSAPAYASPAHGAPSVPTAPTFQAQPQSERDPRDASGSLSASSSDGRKGTQARSLILGVVVGGLVVVVAFFAILLLSTRARRAENSVPSTSEALIPAAQPESDGQLLPLSTSESAFSATSASATTRPTAVSASARPQGAPPPAPHDTAHGGGR